VMPYVSVDVDVYLEDFDDDDLIKELKSRGYSIDKSKREFTWLASTQEEVDLDKALWKLREAYLIEDGDRFRKSFEKILAEYGYYV
jgi:hypothetical protein